MTDVRLGIFDASSNITLDIIISPQWDYSQRRTLNKVDTQTLGGVSANYLYSSHYTFKVPIDYLCHSDTSAINGWWRDGSNLRFTDNSSDSSRYFSVYITNLDQPFHKLKKPYNDTYRGFLQLEEK